MPVPEELKSKIVEAIQKTGFPLENYVCNHLDSLDWRVMNGRYYSDDIDGRAREIDILAYKVRKGQVVDVFSVLLISCKKDHANSWVFMSRRKPRVDPNYNWSPVCFTSRNKLVQHLIDKDRLEDGYISAMGVLKKDLVDVDRNVFAFQQVCNSSPQNDKAIFSSIESLLKAQEYERASLSSINSKSKAKNKRRIYVFNLLTIVDANMFEARYVGNGQAIKSIKNIKYLARYLVNKKEVVARINFVSKVECRRYLRKYDQMSEMELSFLDKKLTGAYSDWHAEPYKEFFVAHMKPIFSSLLKTYIKGFDEEEFASGFDLTRSEDGDMRIEIYVDDAAVLSSINSRRHLSDRVRRILRDEMNYLGSFEFVEYIPF